MSVFCSVFTLPLGRYCCSTLYACWKAPDQVNTVYLGLYNIKFLLSEFVYVLSCLAKCLIHRYMDEYQRCWMLKKGRPRTSALGMMNPDRWWVLCPGRNHFLFILFESFSWRMRTATNAEVWLWLGSFPLSLSKWPGIGHWLDDISLVKACEFIYAHFMIVIKCETLTHAGDINCAGGQFLCLSQSWFLYEGGINCRFPLDWLLGDAFWEVETFCQPDEPPFWQSNFFTVYFLHLRVACLSLIL